MLLSQARVADHRKASGLKILIRTWTQYINDIQWYSTELWVICNKHLLKPHICSCVQDLSSLNPRLYIHFYHEQKIRAKFRSGHYTRSPQDYQQPILLHTLSQTHNYRQNSLQWYWKLFANIWNTTVDQQLHVQEKVVRNHASDTYSKIKKFITKIIKSGKDATVPQFHQKRISSMCWVWVSFFKSGSCGMALPYDNDELCCRLSPKPIAAEKTNQGFEKANSNPMYW